MPRASAKVREEAKALFLTGGMSSNAEIAAFVKVKPHTIGLWRKQEDWDGQKARLEKQTAEGMLRKFASDRINLNWKHYQWWELLMSEVATALKNHDYSKLKILEGFASIIASAQKGERLAKGVELTGHTEEQIRTKAQADNRRLVDLFMKLIRENVHDEETRDRIGRSIVEWLPPQAGTSADDEDEPGADRPAC